MSNDERDDFTQPGEAYEAAHPDSDRFEPPVHVIPAGKGYTRDPRQWHGRLSDWRRAETSRDH